MIMKKMCWAALAACLLIPVVFLGGMALTAFINPERAARLKRGSRVGHG
jgi:hypothetical protein